MERFHLVVWDYEMNILNEVTVYGARAALAALKRIKRLAKKYHNPSAYLVSVCILPRNWRREVTVVKMIAM